MAVAVVLAAVGGRPPARAQSIEAEKEMGRKFAFEAVAQLPLLREPAVVGYVDRIGRKIVGALGNQPFEYRFFVVIDPKVNAFAVPGGYIYVHAGLLLRVSDGDELAGVLGHEVAHVNAHHLARQQEATQLMNYATLLGVMASIVQPAIGAAALGANAAVQLKYRREFEQEADYLGARYMKDAGFDARGMLGFLNKLWEEQRTTPTFMPPYLLSHPLSDERLNKLEAVLRAAQWQGRPPAAAGDELARVQVLTRAAGAPAHEVLADYRREVNERPSDARTRYLFGLALLEAGSYEAARETLEHARALGQDDVDGELGRALLRLRQLEAARESLARAVARHADDARVQLDYGRVLEALGRSDDALAAFRRAAELAPEFDEAHHHAGMLAGRMGHQGDGFFHLAMAAKMRGEYAQALSQLEKAVPLLAPGPRLDQAKADAAEIGEFLRRRRLPGR